MDGWMNRWIDELMDEWIKGWINGWSVPVIPIIHYHIYWYINIMRTIPVHILYMYINYIVLTFH